MTSAQAAWIQECPACIHDMLVRLPPMCRVKGVRPLSCPAPGEVGQVVSYTEDGHVSVVATGNPYRGFCDPEWLEVVEYAPGLTPDDVRKALTTSATNG